MNQKDRAQSELSEQAIDQLVIAQANDDSAWEEAMQVRKSMHASLLIPADLAARAAFLARLHRTDSLEEWLAHIIQSLQLLNRLLPSFFSCRAKQSCVRLRVLSE